jgi:hypothetical protein
MTPGRTSREVKRLLPDGPLGNLGEFVCLGGPHAGLYFRSYITFRRKPDLRPVD